MPKLNQTILWVHAFVSVTIKYKFAFQTLQGYFQLRINGSNYRPSTTGQKYNKHQFCCCCSFPLPAQSPQGAEKSSSSKTYIHICACLILNFCFGQRKFLLSSKKILDHSRSFSGFFRLSWKIIGNFWILLKSNSQNELQKS